MRRWLVMVALAMAGCGGTSQDAACTAGAYRCSGLQAERCWDPNGAGNVAWSLVEDCAWTPGLSCYLCQAQGAAPFAQCATSNPFPSVCSPP